MGTIENVIGNTVAIRFADGSVIETRLKPDGTFLRKLPDGTTGVGTWTNEGGVFRETFAGETLTPEVAPNKKVGDTWDEVNEAGLRTTFSIISGQ